MTTAKKKDSSVKTQSKASGAVLALVTKTLLAVKTAVQSVQELEKTIADCEIVCLRHAQEHGDAMPADRLVKGIREIVHPMTTQLAGEVVAWFNQYSPIRWDAKGNVSLVKEGQPGYKPFNPEEGEATPFMERPQAKRAREAAASAHARELTELTINDIAKRLFGIRKTIQAATMEDRNGQVRGIKTGDKTKMLKAVEAAEQAFIGITGIKPEAGTSEGKALKEAA